MTIYTVGILIVTSVISSLLFRLFKPLFVFLLRLLMIASAALFILLVYLHWNELYALIMTIYQKGLTWYADFSK